MSDRLDRFELKFVISDRQRQLLLPEILPRMRPDGYASSNGFYPVVSLYYDSPDRDCYWEKVRGQGSRRKLRVRVYGSGDGQVPAASFIEVKHKCDGRVVKRRAQMPVAAALRVAEGAPADAVKSAADSRLIEEVHRLVRDRDFRPVCCMRYDRQALADADPASDLRMTFDFGISYRFHDLTPMPDDRNFSHSLLAEGEAVMEVKGTGAVPYWLSRLLGSAGCRLASYSKYCNALAAGDPRVRPAVFARGRSSMKQQPESDALPACA